MNRPIKFRAWCDAKKQWADEVDVFDDGSYLMRFPNEENAERTRLPQPEDTLVQFTGLHDKEGKEIWEGDILSVNLNRRFETPQVGVVEFGTYQDSEAYTTIEHIGYFIKFKPFEGYDIDCTLIDAAKYSHIIGNMFENPELLT